MANNSIDDKWLIVYQGTLDNYKRDSNKDSYKNKMVLVTGDKTATGERDQTSYLCIDNDTHSVNIPIPAIYLRGIGIGKNTYGFPDSILKFASANGINVSFSGGAVTIGINNDTLGKINSIDDKVDQTTYENKVATLEEAIGGKYTKPAGGIPEKDLAFKVATEEEVVNAISKAAADLNDKIDSKVGKTDTIPAENVGGLSYGAKGLASTNPIIPNRIPYLKADAFAFLQPEDFTVEVAYDGLTWVPLDNNNADMRGMFAQWNFGTGFPIDGSNTNWKVGSKIRITLAPKAARNAKVDFVALNVYANGRTFDILTEYYDRSSGKEGWYSVGDQLSINSNGIGFVKYNQYFSFAGYARGGARFTFTITTNTQYGSKIVGISGFGNLAAEIFPTSTNAPYTLGTLWYWDYLKNIYFPNEIYEGGTSLKNKYASITSAIQEIESANDKYISISDVGNTLKPTKRIAIRTASIKDEVDGLVTAQDVRDSIKIPTELPNPKPLTLRINGFPTKTYKGDTETELKIFAPTDVGTNNQVIKCKDGVMADWGYVKWAEIQDKPDVINFAKDLTGVLEATPEEFTYRPSAGNKSIRDEGAVIRLIKGNTTVWGQYVKNGDFTEGTRYFSILNSTLSDNGDGSITVTNKLDNSCGLGTSFDTHIPRGHRVLAIVDYQRDSALSSSTFFYLHKNGGGFDTHITSGFADAQRRVDYAIITSTDDIVGFFFYPFFHGPVGTQSIIYTMAVYDLTAIYGAGNEPTTLEAFREVYPDSYYPYCEPEIRNVKTTAIETIGFNQWDEEWENGSFDTTTGENIVSTQIRCKNLIRVLPNTYYSLSIGNIYMGIWAMFYDENNNILDPVNINSFVAGKCLYVSPADNRNIFVTPADAAWMKFYLTAEYGTSYNNDICINLSHSGVRNGEYHPYKRSIFELPEVLNYFHEGMNGIGEVYDEINSENAIQRWKSRPWQSGDDDNDDVITDGTTTIYKLSAPIVTPILEPIQLVYDVEDFGTERAIAPENSAPFRADIVYQFNAEGRIRDNGRNIERLENKIRSYHDDGAMITIDREIITTKSIIGNSEFRYALPDAPQDVKDDADGTLATEFWVQKNIPTEVATAMMKESLTSPRPFDAYNPNIVYEFAGSLTELTIGMLIQLDGNYDHVWIIRFGCSSVINLSITPKVYWKDGIEPIFGDWGICELKFHTSPFQGEFLGEWKIYR